MIRRHRAKDGSLSYGVRIYRNGERVWIGSFPKLGAAHGDPAVEARAAEHQALTAKPRHAMTCAEYVARYLAEYERHHKGSSTDTARAALRRFTDDFGTRALDSISRIDAKDWTAKVPASKVAPVVTLMNAAVEDELIERNPFRGLGRRTRGRSDQAPPTEQEFERLVAACAVHKRYAPMMRALLVFAAYSGMRPGELFALEWGDIDFDEMRVHVERRLYRGTVDLPKSNAPKTIALTPPARDAILGLPRSLPGTPVYVFTAKRGGRLSQPLLSGYWAQVTARAGLDFDFYLATKHYCVHYLYVKLGLPERAIAAQMGWSTDETGRAIRKLLGVYGHGEIGALEQVDAAFESATVTPLRAVEAGEGSGDPGDERE